MNIIPRLPGVVFNTETLPLDQVTKLSSTTHSSLPSTISGKGGGDVHQPGMGSGGAKDNLTTLKMG